jgi:hypothetical protein
MWRKGYSYIASTPLELCTHPKELLSDTESRAKRGEFRLLDSAGRIFSVGSFVRVSPFGGLMRVAHFLLRSVYAAPVLEAPVTPSLGAFKETLAGAVNLRIKMQLAAGMESLDSAERCVALAADLHRRVAP